MQVKKFLILFLVATFLIAPVVGLAVSSQLQQTYPSAGGTALGGTTASQSIPTLVKYILNLTVWICILAAVLTLIIGGIQYVASAGDVGKMSGAKTRIYGSLLGLAILIGSWFVLYTVNPSFVLPKISYIPIKEGIVFFTEQGYTEFMKATDPGIINDLVQANKAKFINYSVPDLTKTDDGFGPLVFSKCPNKGSMTRTSGSFPVVAINTAGAELDFADFQPYTFAFWGEKAQGAKLTFYNQPNYIEQKDIDGHDLKPQSYDYRGLLNDNGEPIVGVASCGIEKNSNIKDAVIISPYCFKMSADNFLSVYKYRLYANNIVSYLNASNYFLESAINEETFAGQVSNCGNSSGTYLNVMSDQKFRNETVNLNPVAIKHPPLSVKITWSSAGVYLADVNGDERYFDASANNFKDPSINFDQKAQDIKIINDIPSRIYVDDEGKTQKTEPEFNDFLAILHQEDNFSGKLKVYFEQRMYDYGDNGTAKDFRSNKVSKSAPIPAYNSCGSLVKPSDIPTKSVKDVKLFTFDKSIADTDVYLKNKLFEKGNYSFWQDYNFGHLPMVQFNNKGEILSANGFQLISKDEPIVISSSNYDDNGWLNYFGGYVTKEEGRYGNIDKPPASVEVFELSDNPGGSGECQEVQLCTEKGGKGNCLAYTSENNKADEPSTVYYPMPWYLPVPLPYYDEGIGGGDCKSDFLPVFRSAEGNPFSGKIANNIKSIIIKPEGKCAVVLMGGRKTLLAKSYLFTGKAEKRNEVFTNSDYNLDDNEIGQCGSIIGFGRWFVTSCAASIAVYPIK